MRILRLLPFAVACLVGCGGPSIVGKWSMSSSQGTSAMEFTSSTFKQTSDADMGGIKIHLEASGTYTFDGKKLVMTITDLKLPEQLKTFVNEEEVKKKPNRLDVKLEGDKLVLSPEDGAKGAAANTSAGTFTRVK